MKRILLVAAIATACTLVALPERQAQAGELRFLLDGGISFDVCSQRRLRDGGSDEVCIRCEAASFTTLQAACIPGLSVAKPNTLLMVR